MNIDSHDRNEAGLETTTADVNNPPAETPQNIPSVYSKQAILNAKKRRLGASKDKQSKLKYKDLHHDIEDKSLMTVMRLSDEIKNYVDFLKNPELDSELAPIDFRVGNQNRKEVNTINLPHKHPLYNKSTKEKW